MVPATGLTPPFSSAPKTLILTGPTAAGKTALALELAKTSVARGIQLEIINGDSLLFYRGMDIGTAKPTSAELTAVPHHLIDIRNPDEPFTAGDFYRQVQIKLAEIQSRGARALIVGGTGFYLKALLFGLWEGPGNDPDLREELESRSLGELYAELQAQDATSAQRIGAHDRYRLVRAIEVIRLSGKTPTQLEAETNRVPDPRFALWICERDTPELHARIALRTRTMLDQGFISEVRALRAKYPNARSLGAVGYKEVMRHLQGVGPAGRKIRGGEEGLADEIELATRQLVKKQRTWFNNLTARLPDVARTIHLPEAVWIEDFLAIYS